MASFIASFLVLYLGILAFAGIIGFLTGVSSSPIVATVVPIIFTVLTAGGTIYSVLGKDDAPNQKSGHERARFLGFQLLTFALGFFLGLWSGVAVKFNPDAIWLFRQKSTPAYSSMGYTDVRFLATAIELDRRMIKSGLNIDDRSKIFEQIDTARHERRKAFIAAKQKTDELLNVWSTPPVKETHQLIKELQDVAFELRGFELEDEQRETLEQIEAKLEELAPLGNVNFEDKISAKLVELEDVIARYNEFSLLSQEEIKAVELLLGKQEQPDETASPFGSIIVDNDALNPLGAS